MTVRVGEIKKDWAQTEKHWVRLYSRLAGCNTVKGSGTDNQEFKL